ncbi:MAG: hypothetical protein ACI4IW_05315 [Oscillospiraceae bacterium]
MKKLLALLLALVMVLSFAACSNNDEPVEDNSSEETSSEEQSNTEDPAPVAETYKLGMGIVVSTKSSKEASAQVDATVAVVVTDSEGKIVKCELDVAQTKLAVEGGLVPEDLSTVDVRSKQEKGFDYNMVTYGGAIAEWFEQADAFAEAVVGMTGADVEALETVVNEGGHNVAVDETIYASCTMDITAFKAAIVKACNDEYAKEFTAENWTLGLGVNTDVSESTSATADANGVAKLYTDFAAVVVAEDGTILVDLLDVIQPKVEFDTTGAIVTVSDDYDASFRTKKELKEDYNMVTYGGAIAEWYEQALAFETYVEGMTADQVAGIETTTNDHGYTVAADEALTAGCTIQITDFMSTLAKAFANAR